MSMGFVQIIDRPYAKEISLDKLKVISDQITY